MIRIRANKEFNILLDEETSITLNFNNPILDYENTEGDYSYPFTIPAIPENIAFLDALHKLERFDSIIPSFDIELWIGEVGPLMGTMDIDGDITENNYEATLFLGKGEFMYLTKGKKLNQLTLGGDRSITSTADLVANAQLSFPDTDYQTPPIYNQGAFRDIFSEDGGADGKIVYTGIMHNWMNSIKLGRTITTMDFNDIDSALVFMPYLSYVLEQIFIEHGFSIKSNILRNDSELKELIIYNTFANNRIYNVTWYKDYVLNIEGISPAVGTSFYLELDDKSEIFTVKNGLFPPFSDNQIPSRILGQSDPDYATYIYNAMLDNDILTDDFNLYVSYDPYGVRISNKNKNIRIDLYITDNTTGFTLEPVESSIVTEYKIWFDYAFNLTNSMPDMNIQDFLMALKKLINIDYVIDNNTRQVEIIKVDDIFNSKEIDDFNDNIESVYIVNLQKNQGITIKQTPDDNDEAFIVEDFEGTTLAEEVDYVPDLSALPIVLNEVRKVKQPNAYYLRIQKDFSSPAVWDLYQGYYTDYNTGSDIEIESAASSCIMDFKSSQNGYVNTIKAPKVDQLCKTYLWADLMSKNTFSLRLLFYRGIGLSASGYSYPYASSDDRSTVISDIISTYNYSLHPDGETGIISKFWNNTLIWFNKRKYITFQKQLTPVEFYQITLNRKKNVFNNNIIIKNIEITVSNKGIEPAKIEGWTI